MSVVLSASGILVARPVKAQVSAVPGTMTYQAQLTHFGVPYEGAVDVTFGLYPDSFSVTPLWTETHSDVPVSGGVISVTLGSTTPLDSSVFSGDTYLELDVAGEVLSRVPLATVAYAFKAQQALTSEDATRLDGQSGATINSTISTHTTQIAGHDTQLSQQAADIVAVSGDLEPFLTCAAKVGYVYIPGHTSADVDGCVAEADLGGGAETDPVWSAAASSYYTKTSLQTSGQAQVSWGNLTSVPAGFSDGVDNGITSESDPTVLASVKDGVSWGELSGVPAGFADGVDDGLTSESDPTVLASVKDGVSWGELSGVPAGFSDGVDDGLTSESDPTVNALGKATLSCATDQVAKWNGSAWACANGFVPEWSLFKIQDVAANDTRPWTITDLNLDSDLEYRIVLRYQRSEFHSSFDWLMYVSGDNASGSYDVRYSIDGGALTAEITGQDYVGDNNASVYNYSGSVDEITLRAGSAGDQIIVHRTYSMGNHVRVIYASYNGGSNITSVSIAAESPGLDIGTRAFIYRRALP